MSNSLWFVYYSTAAVKDVKNGLAALHLAWERGTQEKPVESKTLNAVTLHLSLHHTL